MGGMEDLKAQQTNKLAALLPEIMNAIGGGDQRTEQILAQQRQQSEQNVQQNNLKNFMRAVISPKTGDITPESITHYAELFNIRPDVAMKSIGDFVNYRKAMKPKAKQYSKLLPNGQVNTVKSRQPLTDQGYMPGTITGTPIKAPNPIQPKRRTWHRKDPVTGKVYTVLSEKQPGKDWSLGKPVYQAPTSSKTVDTAAKTQKQKQALDKEIAQIRKEIYKVKTGKKQKDLVSEMALEYAKQQGMSIPGFGNMSQGSDDTESRQNYLNYLQKRLADKQDELRQLEGNNKNTNAPKKLTFSLEKGWSE